MLRKTLALMLVLLLLPCAALGDTLQIDFNCLNEEAEAAFLADHPGTSVEYGQFGFINTVNDLNTMLLTGQMKYDIFCETNVYTDYRQTMERGYCLDLSSSEVIRQAAACMYPAIDRQLTVDGIIFGLPCGMCSAAASCSTMPIQRTSAALPGLSPTLWKQAMNV